MRSQSTYQPRSTCEPSSTKAAVLRSPGARAAVLIVMAKPVADGLDSDVVAKVASEATGPPLFEGETYQHLEQRPHRWRKQLFLKGRNMAVVHLVYSMRTNHVSPDDPAARWALVVD